MKGIAVSSIILVLAFIVIAAISSYTLYNIYQSTQHTIKSTQPKLSDIKTSANRLLVLPKHVDPYIQNLFAEFQKRKIVSAYKFIDSVSSKDFFEYDKIYIICSGCTKQFLNMINENVKVTHTPVYLITPYFHDYAEALAVLGGFKVLLKEGYTILENEGGLSVGAYNNEFDTLCVDSTSGNLTEVVLDMDKIDVGFENVLSGTIDEVLEVKGMVLVQPANVQLDILGNVIEVVGGTLKQPTTKQNVQYIYIYDYNNRVYVYADGVLVLQISYPNPTVPVNVKGSVKYLFYSSKYFIPEGTDVLYTGRTVCYNLKGTLKFGVQMIHNVRVKVKGGTYKNKIFVTLSKGIYGGICSVEYKNNILYIPTFYSEGTGLYEVQGTGELGKTFVIVPKYGEMYVVPGTIASFDNPLFVDIVLE